MSVVRNMGNNWSTICQLFVSPNWLTDKETGKISSCEMQLYVRLCPSVHSSIRLSVPTSVRPSVRPSVRQAFLEKRELKVKVKSSELKLIQENW